MYMSYEAGFLLCQNQFIVEPKALRAKSEILVSRRNGCQDNAHSNRVINLRQDKRKTDGVLCGLNDQNEDLARPTSAACAFLPSLERRSSISSEARHARQGDISERAAEVAVEVPPTLTIIVTTLNMPSAMAV